LLLRILLGILVVAAVLAGAIAYAAFRLPQPIQIDMSGNRRALLYRLSGGPRPTLIVLHSYLGDALTTARYSGFLQAALPRGFNVVFPEATNGTIVLKEIRRMQMTSRLSPRLSRNSPRNKSPIRIALLSPVFPTAA
jgi:poly(3-hydroxybutyrate) depolymerase